MIDKVDSTLAMRTRLELSTILVFPNLNLLRSASGHIASHTYYAQCRADAVLALEVG